MRAALLVLLLSGCTPAVTEPSDAGADALRVDAGLDAAAVEAGVDAAVDDDAAVVDEDAGLEQRVPCGAAMCDTRQVCCTMDDGVTGTCSDISPGCSPGQQRLICDDVRDCVATAECCYAMRATSCLPDGTCDAIGGQIACRTDAECSGGSCCPLAPGSPYSTCRSAACP